MTAIVVAENGAHPVHEDGSDYYAALLIPGQPSIFGDTLTEIVAETIDDYPNVSTTDPDQIVIDSGEALLARVAMLEMQAAAVQALVVGDRGTVGFAFTEDELTALFASKSGTALELDKPWDSQDTPLLLVTTNYAPFTAASRPAGSSIIWLDPTNELRYLQSLATIHGGELFIKVSRGASWRPPSGV
ncbi:hypothetical protein [Microbacterium enclense]|uniref:hypothetical protein n=1 Tax=Microbacterium enclense TaxID=993073 RepID=UPI003F7F1426